MFVAGLLSQQFIPAQGTVYLSNLGQPSAGSLAVGSDSWLAEIFRTGTDVNGYMLNSVQLEMTDALGSPNGFAVMLYSSRTLSLGPESSLGTLDGSLNPVAGGVFTYTPASSLTLLPNTYYYVVLTAGTTVANGTYE